MTDDKFLMFANRLTKVYKHLSKQAKRQHISCYRVYDHDLPEFPFMIELYEQHLYVAEYQRFHQLDEDAHHIWLERSRQIMAEVLQIPEENIFIRIRKRKHHRQDQYQRNEVLQHELQVEEQGHSFIVNLSDYLDTGLFLDHRITRKMVQEKSKNKNVLNLFAYTGSFSVYAAAGGANAVTTIDLSNTYLNWAKRNMQLNGFNNENHYKFIQADVKQLLPQLPPKEYDIIIIDPPTFSNSKRMENILDIQQDHVMLLNACLNTLKTGGEIYFSTNYTKFVLNEEDINTTTLKDITKATTPFDFTGKLNRKCYLLNK